ncbi:MAG: PKD domain-containing protein, partial [Bacteroidales bacterium]|nr:PKD domain-containing protein [Bacteroidales bacterium]
MRGKLRDIIFKGTVLHCICDHILGYYIPFLGKKVLFCIVLSFSTILSSSQPNRRTNHWYLPHQIGIDFSSGYPVEDSSGLITEILDHAGSSVMSDTLGKLLFYSDGKNVWNRNHIPMTGVIGGFGLTDFWPGSQGALCLKKPNSDNIYYVFTIRDNNIPFPMFYYTIDLDQNGGLGDIIDTTHIPAGWDAAEKLTAAYHRNKRDIWIITRKFQVDSYAAFLLTSDGLNYYPVLSPAPDRNLNSGPDNWGHMKISYDKNYLVSCYYGATTGDEDIEICRFDDKTGSVTYLYSFKLHEIINYPATIPYNCEFSPDSKFLYIGGIQGLDTITQILQFEIKYIDDKDLFLQSVVNVGQGQGFNLQLAPDGKIYCLASYPAMSVTYDFDKTYGIIHHPQNKGILCDYEPYAYEFNHGYFIFAGINFMTDYLLRFDFDGQCALDTFYFDPWFFPEPTWIQWNFGDTASGSQNISYDLRPKHVFSHGGEYEVSVWLTYPSGRVEKTSRVVAVDSIPYPNLGPDTLICSGSSVTLDAGCNAQFFTWSTGQWGVSSITVSD